LQLEEKKLREAMDPVVEASVRGKKLALFGEMLSFYKYLDPKVLDELTQGASLTGEIPKTGMLPFKFTPAGLTVEALKKQSEFRRQSLMSDAKGSGDSEVDMEVWRQTLEERARGWLIGPLDAEIVPADAPISKRCGLRQNRKSD
jgi:hypothetical protein